MPRWKLGKACRVSEWTVERWEKGESEPSPDDVDKIEKALGIPGLWHDWMMSHYDSYRYRHITIPIKNNLTEMVVRIRHELDDITPMFKNMERDALDGDLNDSGLWRDFRREAMELQAAVQQMLDRIPNNI